MRQIPIDASDERTILVGLAVSSKVLSHLRPLLSGDLFRSRWANLVGTWCADYWDRYGVPPKKELKVLFHQFAEEHPDREEVRLIGEFLSSLAREFEAPQNDQFILDRAETYFTRLKLERLCLQVQSDLHRADLGSARRRVEEFSPVSVSSSAMVDVWTDREALYEAIEGGEDDILVHYPGAVGAFFGPHLCREGFISFLAPEKRGKSFFLIDLAWRAARGKRRTLFYSVGDMTRTQVMRRLVARAARRPIRAGLVEVPRAIRRTEGGEVEVEMSQVEFPSPMTFVEARRAMKQVLHQSSHTVSLLKMRCTPNSTTTVAEIRADIASLSRQGWIPDVVVVDYADILAPEAGTTRMEFRHQTNETWKALRRLSQECHVLLVTATQSDAASYDVDTLRRKHFSEDKRKLSHVTGMVGLNQTDEEKRKGVFRLNWILLREGECEEGRCVWVAGSLPIASPVMVSCW